MVGSAALGDDHGLAPHLHGAAPRAQAGPPLRCAAVALLNASHSNCVLLTTGHSVRRCLFKTLYVEATLEWRRKVPAPSPQCLREQGCCCACGLCICGPSAGACLEGTQGKAHLWLSGDLHSGVWCCRDYGNALLRAGAGARWRGA